MFADRYFTHCENCNKTYDNEPYFDPQLDYIKVCGRELRRKNARKWEYKPCPFCGYDKTKR